ncbi:MAG: diguanylate cyclase [Spirochaetes bacterium]|nr:diguanylate cyclase [Spirochaetota bacterium]
MEFKFKKNEIINNRYQIIEKMGEGGMSVVFKARDKEKKEEVAIKFLKQGVTSSYIEDVIRFRREIEAVSKLKHPNIVNLYSSGEYKNVPYIIMESLKGDSLADMLQGGKNFGQKETLEIIKQLAGTLHYVHGRGILHRDMKPGNIIINKKGNKFNAKLLDFGVSFIMELGHIKGEQEVVGTFGFMSPEATGMVNKRIDERSDLYSLGIIFYRLLTGFLPFKATETSKLLHQQVAVMPLKPSKIRPGISMELEDIVMKLLYKDPELRYQSAKGLLYDIERFQKGDREFVIGEKDQKIKISYQTRLVGREAELSKMQKLFNKARDSQGSICLIAGEPGVGKSRLLEEMRGYCYEEGGIFIGGRCLDQENKTPYQPFRDAINGYIKHIERLVKKDKEREIKRIKKVLGALGEIVIRMNGNMKQLLADVPELVKLDPERENQRFLMTSSRFFRHLGQEGSVCLIYIDDLQWADEGTLRLLKEIASSIKGSNLFIVGAYRDNEVTEKHSLIRIKTEAAKAKYPLDEIKINPFSYDRMNKMIAGLLGERESRAHDLTRYVNEKSQGNPFFAISILRELVEEKGLVWKEGYWEADWKKITRIPVSANMIDIILKRIEDLTPQQSEILYLSSVIGREFEIDMLYPLVELNKEEVVRIVDEAISMQLIQESIERGKKIFIHDKIRDAFYKKISKKRRQTLHLKVARVIEEKNKNNINEVVFDLAHHYYEGGDRDKSLQYMLPAALKARANYANEESIRYYTLGIELLEEKNKKNSIQWIKAKEGLSDQYLVTGQCDDAIKICRELLPLKEKKIEKARVYRKIGVAYFKKGDWELCENNLVEGLAMLGEKVPLKKSHIISALLRELIVHILHSLFPSLPRHRKKVKPDDKELIWFYLTINWMYILSNILKFICSVLRTLNICESRIGKSRELGIGLGGYASLCMAIPLFKRSIKYHIRGLKLREDLRDEWGVAQSLQWLGYCYKWKGEYQKSAEYFQQSLEKFQKIGDLWEIGMVYNGLGYQYRYEGNFQKALAIFTQYLEISEKILDDYGVASCKNSMAHCYIDLEDYKTGEKLTREILALSEEKKLWIENCAANIHMGRLEMSRGNFDKAIPYLEKARKLDKENEFLKEYSVYGYPYLSIAYIEDYKIRVEKLKNKKKKSELKKIKKSCKEALSQTKPWKNHYGISLRAMAKYYEIVGKRKLAEKFFLKSIESIETIGRKYELAMTLLEYGQFLNKGDKSAEAKGIWQRSLDLFKDLDSKRYITKCSLLLDLRVEKSDEVSPQDRLKIERRMTTVLGTSRFLSSILDLDELLEKIMDKTIELVGAERGVLLLYPDEGQKRDLEVRVVRNVEKQQLKGESFGTSRSIIEKVEKEKKPLIIEDAGTDVELKQQASVVKFGLKSVLCAPIMARGNMLGVIYLDNRLVTGLFNQEDLMILDLVSSQAGVSIENARLYQRAITDGLTGLFNRIFFDNYLMKSVHEAQRYGKDLVLLIIDIDHFKKFNDVYGHQAGDLVLVSVADIIKENTRVSDIAARYGGDEFVMILPETSLEGGWATAEKIRNIVKSTKVLFGMGKKVQELKTTLSIGVSQMSEGEDRIDFLHNADNALYEAKEKGRDKVLCYGRTTKITKIKQRSQKSKRKTKKNKTVDKISNFR